MTARRKQAPAEVVWRDGVHVTGTPIWCDARRARASACFISRADVPGAGRHKQIIATEATLALLPPEPGRGRRKALAVPYGRPFTLGTARVELFSSGGMPGAASLLVERDGARVVYAGAIGAAAETRACDALVLDAPYGHPRFRFPPRQEALAALAAWVAATLAAGDTPVVLAAPLSGGPDIARALGGRHRLRAHRAFVDAARRLRKLGHELPPLSQRGGEVILWPLGGAGKPPVERARVALASGLAQDPGAAHQTHAQALFALAESADGRALVEYAHTTGAKRVYVVGAGAPELVRALAAEGFTARRLGPMEQLRLF